MTLRPIRRHVLLLDDQEESAENGVVMLRKRGSPYLDYLVVQIGTDEETPGFGTGDRVILSDPNAGRRVRINGVIYRLVRRTDIVAAMEG